MPWHRLQGGGQPPHSKATRTRPTASTLPRLARSALECDALAPPSRRRSATALQGYANETDSFDPSSPSAKRPGVRCLGTAFKAAASRRTPRLRERDRQLRPLLA